MKKKFVDEYHGIEENEMLDLVAIAQSAPGPIAVNGAIVVGYKLAGMTGVVTAIIGTIIPPFLIISLISVCYNAFRDNFIVSQMLSGMQAGVGAVIASVTYEMGAGIVHGKNTVSMCIMAGAFLASCVFHVNVVFVVIACGLIGALLPFDMAGIDFALTALFIVIFLDQLKAGTSKLPAVVSIVASLLCLVLLGPDNFLLPALSVSVAALVLLRPRLEGKEAAQ